MKQSLLRLGVFGDEVYVVHQNGLILSRETLKPIPCEKCGEFLICESVVNTHEKEALKIIKKFCVNCD